MFEPSVYLLIIRLCLCCLPALDCNIDTQLNPSIANLETIASLVFLGSVANYSLGALGALVRRLESYCPDQL